MYSSLPSSSSSSLSEFNNYGAIGGSSSVSKSEYNGNNSLRKGLMIFFGLFLTILIGIYCFYGGFSGLNSLFAVGNESNDTGVINDAMTDVYATDGSNSNGNNNNKFNDFNVNSENYYESMNFLSVKRNNNVGSRSSSRSSSSINNKNENVIANPLSPVSNKIGKLYESILMSRAG